MQTIRITIGLFLFIFIACKEYKNEESVEAQYPVVITNAAHVDIESFIVNIDTIRLETKDESLFSDVLKMRIMNNRFYILTNNFKTIHIFDLDGKFISKINNRGNGPEEYISISSFEVDRINGRIILADSFSRRIFVYNKDGDQESVINLDFLPAMILPYKSGFINLYTGSRNTYTDPRMENYNVHFLDEKGKFISSSIEIQIHERIDVASPYSSDILSNGDILFQPVLSDIIYKIGDDKKIESYYQFINRSQYKLLTPKDKKEFQFVVGGKNSFEKKEVQKYLLSWGDVQDLTNYVFFSFSGYHEQHYLYYSKSTNETFFIDPKKVTGNNGLKRILLNYPKSVIGDTFYVPVYSGMIEYTIEKAL